MAYQDHQHLTQDMPLHHYPDDHHLQPPAAAVFRHHSPEDSPTKRSPSTWLSSSILHPQSHQWLSTQSQSSPPTTSDAGPENDITTNVCGGDNNWEREKCKADILGHPLYEQLLSTHVACLRIATPVDQLPRIDAQLAQSQQVMAKYSVLGQGQQPLDDKDLDQFMVTILFIYFPFNPCTVYTTLLVISFILYCNKT